MPTQKVNALIEDFGFHTMLVHRFVDGVSHEESVLPLPFEHNCMNWILGHIIANRSHVLESVGAAHPWQELARSLYHQGTPAITPESPSIRFEELVRYLDESMELLKAALEPCRDEFLDENHSNYRGKKTRHEHLSNFHWHESFHLGQLEILRAFVQSKRS